MNEVAALLAEGREAEAASKLAQARKTHGSQFRTHAFYASYLMSRLQFDSAAAEFEKSDRLFRKQVSGKWDPFGTAFTADVVNGVYDHWESVRLEWIENELFRGNYAGARALAKDTATNPWWSRANRIRADILELRALRGLGDTTGSHALVDSVREYITTFGGRPQNRSALPFMYIDFFEVSGDSRHLDSARTLSGHLDAAARVERAYLDARIKANLRDPGFPEALDTLGAAFSGNVCYRPIRLGLGNVFAGRDYYDTKVRWGSLVLQEAFTLDDLPVAIQEYLGVNRPGRQGIADRGKSFNATDVVEEDLPMWRFLTAGTSGETWLVAVESGGRAHNIKVFQFGGNDTTTVRKWVLLGHPQTLGQVIELLPGE